MPAKPYTSDHSRTAEEHPLSTAVWALTARGCELARIVAAKLGGALFVPRKYAICVEEQAFQNFSETFSTQFHAFHGHVCVAATGIIVRCMVPLLRDKTADPGVVVLDQNGRFAVSLVGGHLGGANALAERTALITGGHAVITTATDTVGLPALDVLARALHLVPDRPEQFKLIAAALLDGETLQLLDQEGRLRNRLLELGHAERFEFVHDAKMWRGDRPGIWVSWQRAPAGKYTLGLHPRRLMAGLGCHRGVCEERIVAFVRDVFEREGLALASLAALGTIRTRAGEEGLIRAAAHLGAELVFFDPAELHAVQTPNPSATAARLAGTQSVCEAGALLLARTNTLLTFKAKGDQLTLAVALRSNCSDHVSQPIAENHS